MIMKILAESSDIIRTSLLRVEFLDEKFRPVADQFLNRSRMNKFHWTAPPMTEERFEKLKEWAEQTKQPEILSYVKEMDHKIRKRSRNS